MQNQNVLNPLSWVFSQQQLRSWKPLTAVPKNLHLTNLKEAFIYNSIEYAKTEQNIYVQRTKWTSDSIDILNTLPKGNI